MEPYSPTNFADGGAIGHPRIPNYVAALLTPRCKTLTLAIATPQFIGEEDLRFKQLRIKPVAGNSANIEIQVLDEDGNWTTVDEVAPGTDFVDWSVYAPGGAWHGKSFRLKANNDGDKALIIYA